MSGRLDKSLDEIITSQRGGGRGRTRRGARRSGPVGKAATVAPVGGIKKNPKSARGSVKPIPTGPSGNGEGRILVSGFVSHRPSPLRQAFANDILAKGYQRAYD